MRLIAGLGKQFIGKRRAEDPSALKVQFAFKTGPCPVKVFGTIAWAPF